MKKLFTLLALFILLSIPLFAEFSLAGVLGVRATLIGGNNDTSYDLLAGASFVSALVQVNFNNQMNTAGGLIRWYAMGRIYDRYGSGASAFAWVWWKPIEALYLRLGLNPNGDFFSGTLTGWAYTGDAQDYVAIDLESLDGLSSQIAYSTGFGSQFESMGVIASFTATEDLVFNLAIPLAEKSQDSGHWYSASTVYKQVFAQARYAIPSVGIAHLTFEGLGGIDKELERYESIGNITAAFYLSRFEHIAFDFGVTYGLPYKNYNGFDTYPDLAVGFGVKFSSGNLVIAGRAAATFAGKEAGVNNPLVLAAGLLPSWDFGFLTAFLNLGFGISIPEGDNDATFDYFINPYISKEISPGFTFYAGIQYKSLTGTLKARNEYQWAIPIGLCYEF